MSSSDPRAKQRCVQGGGTDRRRDVGVVTNDNNFVVVDIVNGGRGIHDDLAGRYLEAGLVRLKGRRAQSLALTQRPEMAADKVEIRFAWR